jgi:hypothetical protein
MRLNQLKKAFELCRASKVTPAIVGTSGVGKTSMCKQVASEMGFDGYRILRPSLVADVGDLIGLPDFEVIVGENGKSEKRTSFAAPDWLPKTGEKVLIIIDEINRTQKDIVMAMFDLIEAEKPKIGNYVLPEGSMVVATLNPPTDNYTVLDFKDSAFTSRLCFIKVMPDLKVFLDWGKQEDANGEANLGQTMQDFLQKEDKFFGMGEDFEVDMFFGSSAVEVANHFKNNNRSKKKVSDLYENGKKLKVAKGIIFECIQGIAGKESSVAFELFAKTYKNIVTLEDLLADKTAFERFDYKAISNISKVLEELKTAVEKGKVTKKNIPSLVGFLDKIPLDTLKGFIMYAASITGKTKEEKRLEKFTDHIMDEEIMDAKIDYLISAEKTTESESEKVEEVEDDIPF